MNTTGNSDDRRADRRLPKPLIFAKPMLLDRLILGSLTPRKMAGFRAVTVGFSLVEMALALGVMSFSILVMLSLVPIGLNSYNDSRAQTRATDIATSIVADLTEVVKYPEAGGAGSTSPLLGLNPALNEQTLYFDQNGFLINTASSAVYTAFLTITPSQSSTLSPAGIMGTLKINWLGGGKDTDAVTVFIGIAGE